MKIFSGIFGSLDIFIKYKAAIDIETDDVDELRQKFKHLYSKNEKKEIDAGMTLFGPHRDDFTILIDNKDIKEYGSQGQQKLAMIALKLSEINIFTEVTGKIIITANELNEIRNINNDCKIFNIKNKKVTEKVIINGTSTK